MRTKKYFSHPIGIIVSLLLFYPLGVYLVWKHSGWTVTNKWWATVVALPALFIAMATVPVFLLFLPIIVAMALWPFTKWARPVKAVVSIGLLIAWAGMLSVLPKAEATAEISEMSMKNGQEVLEERVTINGEYDGDATAVRINGEQANITKKKHKFDKSLALKPGDNEVEVVLLKDGKEKDKEKLRVFYDYDSKVAEDKKKAEDEEQAKVLSRVPEYELVRRENTDKGFAAIVYISGPVEEYLLTNAVKDIKSRNSRTEAISLLIFSTADKPAVEQALEGPVSDVVTQKALANYEKTNDQEQLFVFTGGLEGEKLALEVK